MRTGVEPVDRGEGDEEAQILVRAVYTVNTQKYAREYRRCVFATVD